MRKITSSFPLYLFLTPIFFILHHNNELLGFIPFSLSVFALLLCYAGLASYFGIVYYFIRSIQLTSITTFLLALFILFFGALLDGLKYLFDHAWITKYIVLVPLIIVVIFLLSWLMSRRSALLKKVQAYLNTLFLLFIIVELFNLGVNIFRSNEDKNLIYPGKVSASQYSSGKIEKSKPDIYFIVFDAYTNDNTLQHFWGFKNSDLLNWMKSQNFYVIDSSNANYNFTPFSISSTLNMDYLPVDIAERGNEPRTILRGVQSMSNNEVITYLKREDYRLRYFIPFNNQVEDIGLVHEFNNFGAKELYNQTFPGRFQHDVFWNFLYGKWKPGWIKKKSVEELPSYQNFLRRAQDVGKIVSNVKESCDSVEHRQPQFVYAHFMITHQPHLFDSSGNLRKGEDLINQSNLFTTYIQQVKFANTVITELVDYVKLHNRKNTIIIIEGDHGFRDLPPSMTQYQFPNLNALYFPDHDYTKLYPQMSPVNTFRIVFNHYFGQNLPLLKDSSVIVKF